MEDERYDELMWDRYEDEQRWMGWQGRYSERNDPYFESLNRLNAASNAGRRQYGGDALNFESVNRGPYSYRPREPFSPRSRRRATPEDRSTIREARVQQGQTGSYAGIGPRGYQRSDDRIWEDVCERLANHGWIDPSDIEVVVQQGEVLLQGTVENRPMKRLAEDIAESVTGVKDVINRLRLSGRVQPD